MGAYPDRDHLARYLHIGRWNRCTEHPLLLVAIGVAAMSGCVIPQSIDIQGENTPPRLDLRRTTPEIGTLAKPLPVLESPTGTARRTTAFTIGVDDPDDEPVALRLFLDLSYSTFLAENTVGPSRVQPRIGLVEVDGLCDEIVNFDRGLHVVSVWVSDSGFVNTGPDLHQPVTTEEGRVGGRDSVTWIIDCQPAGGA